MPDSELSLPGFSIFRLDRNRHGGGILVYIKCSRSPSVIPYDSSPIELLLLSVKLKHSSYTLATFYRLPSSSTFSSLQSVLESLPHSTSLNLILLGDFNVDVSSPSSSLNLYLIYFLLIRLYLCLELSPVLSQRLSLSLIFCVPSA